VKLARILPVLSLALLAASAAAKPGAPPVGAAADGWRAQAVRVCADGSRDTNAREGDIDFACGCAADRLIARRPAAAPPPAAPRDLRAFDASDLVECAAQRNQAFATRMVRRVTELAMQQATAVTPPPAPPPPPTASDEAKPDDAAAPASAEAPKRPDATPGPLFGGLSLPAWLTDSGLPTWALVALGFLVFMVLRGLLRREDRRDLVAAPSSMRRIASPKPMVQRPPPPRS
jgi:hypothetical protein